MSACGHHPPPATATGCLGLPCVQAAIYDVNGMLLDAFQRGSAGRLQDDDDEDSSTGTSAGFGQPPSAEVLLAMVGRWLAGWLAGWLG